MGFIHDLQLHYDNFLLCFKDAKLSDILKDPRVFIIGSDYYHITVKYILSRFTTSRQIFGAVAAGLYASVFIFFFRQLKQFYNQKTTLLTITLLLCVVTIVEFYWYQGYRFWIGVFYFAGMYLKYMNTNNKGYLAASLLCIFFHYTLLVLWLMLALEWLFEHSWKYLRYIVFAISINVRSLNVDFVPLLLKYLPWADELSLSITDQRIRSDVRELMGTLRENANVVYTNRLVLDGLMGLLILLVMRFSNVALDQRYKKLLFLAFTLYTIANFGYADLTFFTRFTEFSVLLLFIYIYIAVVKNYKDIEHHSIFFWLIALMIVICNIAVVFVQVRQYIFYPELIFGNFFVDWDGNELHIS